MSAAEGCEARSRAWIATGVTLSGELGRRSSVELAERLTRDVDSVVDVQTDVTYRWDDSKLVK